jgi:hypothetical protein
VEATSAKQTCDYKQGKASHEAILAKRSLSRKLGSAFGKLGSTFATITGSGLGHFVLAHKPMEPLTLWCAYIAGVSELQNVVSYNSRALLISERNTMSEVY